MHATFAFLSSSDIRAIKDDRNKIGGDEDGREQALR